MNKIILDSGAYTASTKGVEIDINAYIQFCKEHSKLFDVCINLDVIGNPEGSWRNWKYIKEAGVDTMPVFHHGSPEKYLKRYLRMADYIGLGAIANLNTYQRVRSLKRIWKDYLLNEDGTPQKKIHGLGLTAVPILLAFPWYSVDSSTAVKNASFGKIFLPVDPVKRDLRTIDTYIVSEQGRHEVGKTSSLFCLPKSVRDAHSDFIHSLGFTLGTIQNRKLPTSRRCAPDEVRGFFPTLGFNKEKLSVTEESDAPTLCNSYLERYKWNLKIWDLLTQRYGNGREVYEVCSTAAHIQLANEIRTDAKVLVSYLRLSKGVLKQLRRFKGLENED